MTKKNYIFFIISIIGLIIIGVISLKALFLTIGILSLFMYVNIMLSISINMKFNGINNLHEDVFWRMLFIVFTAIGFGLFFGL